MADDETKTTNGICLPGKDLDPEGSIEKHVKVG